MYSLREKNIGGIAVVYRNGQNSSLVESLIKENPSKLYFIPLDDPNQSFDIIVQHSYGQILKIIKIVLI